MTTHEHNPWKAALDQELVSLHLGTTDTPGYDTPKAALDAIIQWHVKIALDPAVSSDAAALIAAERERCAKVRERIATHAWRDWNDLKARYKTYDDGRSDGAGECADAIKKHLK